MDVHNFNRTVGPTIAIVRHYLRYGTFEKHMDEFIRIHLNATLGEKLKTGMILPCYLIWSLANTCQLMCAVLHGPGDMS